MRSARDREFADFVTRENETLKRCAYLCHGDTASARDAVEAALASIYATWKDAESARLLGLRLVTQPERAQPSLPWRSKHRFSLVDVAPVRPTPQPMLVRELDQLSDSARRVLVLSHTGGLGVTQIAQLVGAGEREVDGWLEAAHEHLDRRRAVHGSRGTVTEALERAVPLVMTERGPDSAADRAHGRFLIKARRRRGLGVGVAAVAAVALLVQGVGVSQSRVDLSNERPEPAASIVPAAVPTFASPPRVGTAPCDTTEVSCQDLITRTWRYDVFDVAAEYLDPEGGYFSIVGYDEEEEGSWRWDGSGGALGVDILGLDGGTEVSIQIASSREFADQCGTQTDQNCRRQRFMSGNWFNLTQSSSATEGVEVQFVPYDEVITIVAKGTGKGKTLPIDRGQLLAMIEDPRLRLPAI